MKVSCGVIRDLLPLYVEGMVSRDTRMLVEEHVKSCPQCAKELEDMKNRYESSLHWDVYVGSLKKLKNTLFKKRLQTIVFTAMLTLTVAAVIIANLTAPNYISYSPEVVHVTEKDDGTVFVEFNGDVSGYIIERSETERDEMGYQYDIIAWNSYWNRYIIRSSVQNVVLNPNGEKVSAVYYLNYFSSESGPDILIYGEDQYPNGGRLTLPRLALTYYFLIAFVVLALSVLLFIVFRKNERIRYWLIRVAAIPASYIVGQMCVKGFYFPTFILHKDLIAIMTIMVLSYITFLLGTSLINYYRRKIG